MEGPSLRSRKTSVARGVFRAQGVGVGVGVRPLGLVCLCHPTEAVVYLVARETPQETSGKPLWPLFWMGVVRGNDAGSWELG